MSDGILSYLDSKITTKEKFISILKKYFMRYFIDAFTGMAQGLFCTLIAGTILAQIASWCGDNAFAYTLNYIASIAKMLMGAGIGVGIAHKLGAKPLVMFTAAVAGMVGAWAGGLVDCLVGGATAFTLPFGVPGNPIGSYVVALVAIEIAGLYAGKTKLDIVLVPLGMMALCLAGIFLAWPFIKFVDLIGVGVAKATFITPVAMGIIVAVVVGVLLTLPTSSAAIWLAVANPVIGATALAAGTYSADLQNAMYLAGGAAVVGCACQMVGFAVQSFRENRWGGLIAQGLGTSMLQIPNLMRHPQIMLPPIIASSICGPLSTCVFMLRCNPTGGGMGTSGLVGIFGTIEASQGVIPDWQLGVGIALLFFVVPTVVCLLVSGLMRKRGWIKPDYMKLEL